MRLLPSGTKWSLSATTLSGALFAGSLSMVLFERPVKAVWRADQLASRCFLYRASRDVVLDTILGPEQDSEYVSTTSPAGPPPTIS